MKQLTNLTEMEKQVLTALINALYAEAGFSDVDVNDLSKATNIPNKSIRGVFSSLVQKEICYIDKKEDNGTGYDFVNLKSSYYGLHPRWAKEENLELIEIA
jgi:NDP-sugar pyrophosphorylase family protein